ncbi:protein-L-isoaspartate(D-aspartate) O-methyltransferase [Puteibacter caeruleilacunae]|nr:protein-L-isoaspartate(D-aspartate) O-methyltransferase [Puteibacter caeruleilacunae]
MSESFQYKGQRRRLVEGLRIKGITDEAVLDAIGNVPRHRFLESSFSKFAYKDQAFPIGSGQTISQPFTVAYQSQLLKVQRHDKILEVGTGSGYQAAVLLELGAQVYTIERHKSLYNKVQQFLPELGYHPRFFFGDGYQGLPTYGPFDKIIVTAAAPHIPEKLKEQLKVGGLMVIPVGPYERQKMTVVKRISENRYDIKIHGDFVFVPMLKGTDI